MATQPAVMAATARAAEAGEAWAEHGPLTEEAPSFLTGWRALVAGLAMLVVVGLLALPALAAAVSIVSPNVVSQAMTWLERLTVGAPAVLTARALVAVVAMVVIARSDGRD